MMFSKRLRSWDISLFARSVMVGEGVAVSYAVLLEGGKCWNWEAGRRIKY